MWSVAEKTQQTSREREQHGPNREIAAPWARHGKARFQVHPSLHPRIRPRVRTSLCELDPADPHCPFPGHAPSGQDAYAGARLGVPHHRAALGACSLIARGDEGRAVRAEVRVGDGVLCRTGTERKRAGG